MQTIVESAEILRNIIGENFEGLSCRFYEK